MRAAIAPLPHFENRPLTLAAAFALAGLIHALGLGAWAPIPKYGHEKEMVTCAQVVELDVGLLKRVPAQEKNTEKEREIPEASKRAESASTSEYPTYPQAKQTKPSKKTERAAVKASPPRQISARKTAPAKTGAEKTPANQAAKAASQEKAAPKTSAVTPPMPYPAASKPRYPPLARKRGQEGTVKVLCQVDAYGNVAGVSLAQGSGFRLLDEAGLKTARLWKFRPAQKDGANVTGEITVSIEFRLLDD